LKILNLYAGIGGNRKLWGEEHEITAIEIDENIANVYKNYFPNDEVIITDAHKYLLENYKNYDFIWSSPPCPTHSQMRYNTGFKANRKYRKVDALYPDMKLYQEIILLDKWFDGKWVVENVISYYTPLIPADKKLHRHLCWCNFTIGKLQTTNNRLHNKVIGGGEVYGFNIKETDINNKRQALRNMVDPELGQYILDCAIGVETFKKSNQETMF